MNASAKRPDTIVAGRSHDRGRCTTAVVEWLTQMIARWITRTPPKLRYHDRQSCKIVFWRRWKVVRRSIGHRNPHCTSARIRRRIPEIGRVADDSTTSPSSPPYQHAFCHLWRPLAALTLSLSRVAAYLAAWNSPMSLGNTTVLAARGSRLHIGWTPNERPRR